MQSHEIRRRFQQFFQRHGHEIVASGSLVPENDPTLFFTNAGMVPFKDVFIGQETRPYRRATTVQKCLRVSGKHNDLENVGRTPRHHTFFEMLGNFSFGDYFKEEAIAFAWELLTVELGMDGDKLWVTIFEEDDEAYELWKKLDVIPEERIQRLGAKENFWSMGETGPCGPCTEIHYDHGEDMGPAGGPATDSPRYVEIWNLVFMQFERDASGKMTPLPKPSIDTGAGLERIAAVLQGVRSNYDTDCFTPIIAKAAELAGHTYGSGGEADVAMRVIADHARATAFLVADGVMPSNEERGYVLRRIMRRAIRHGVKVGLKEPFLHKVADVVVEQMAEAYPELRARQDFMREVILGEEQRFAQTLDHGLALLEKQFASLGEGGTLPGAVAFQLHDTYGFPLDLTQLIAEERKISVDEAGYHAAMEEQRAAGRAAWKGSGQAAVHGAFHKLLEAGHATTFTGHERDIDQGSIVALLLDDAPVPALTAGQTGAVLLDRTPFYAEGGGQVGDTGTLVGPGGKATVTGTIKPVGDLFVHQVELVEGKLEIDDKVEATVDAERRNRTRLNHTATHLLHAALQQVLGSHVAQKGSLVTPDRLRFDFSHHKGMEPEQVRQVEDIVYTEVLKNTGLQTTECSMDEAKARGAMALFGEKYGDQVRVVDVPGFSTELCGGTHASRTGDIGLFRIVSEGGVAAGVRRIEAVTGHGAMHHARSRDDVATQVALTLRTSPEQVGTSLGRVLDDRRRFEKEIASLKRELAQAQSGDLSDQARDFDGFKVLAAEFNGDAKAIRDEADRLRDSLGSAVVVLGSREGGKVQLVATVSKDLAGNRVHAGNLIREVAKLVGGRGGGRPDMAQAGGSDVEALPGALEQVYELIGA